MSKMFTQHDKKTYTKEFVLFVTYGKFLIIEKLEKFFEYLHENLIFFMIEFQVFLQFYCLFILINMFAFMCELIFDYGGNGFVNLQ